MVNRILSRSDRALLLRAQERKLSLADSAPWRAQIRSCISQRWIARRGVVYHLTSRGASQLHAVELEASHV